MLNNGDEPESKHSSLDCELERGFSARLKEAIGDRSVLSFAKECGFSDSLVRKYLSGSLPGLDKALVMARVAGVSLEWLAMGEAQPQSGAPKEPAPGLGDEYALIPRYDVQVSTGPGALVDQERELGRMAFRRDWLRQEGFTPASLVLVSARGDSMESTISEGDVLLVDTAGRTVQGDGIYVLRVEDDVIAKRLQRDWQGGLWVRSDNPVYEDQHITDEATARLNIVGRVVWVGKRV
jgi:phage repressor protein C with HTH and peptisase S24 domain